MRAGGGKAKGSAFERDVCKQLSKWVTKGERDDVFWRSAISGGRATVRFAKGKTTEHQAGDICAVHPSGHSFTSYWFIECKFVKSYRIDLFFLGDGGLLYDFWQKAVQEASKYRRTPMLIAKQNRGRTIVVIPESERVKFGWAKEAYLGTIMNEFENACIVDYDAMLRAKYECRVVSDNRSLKRVRL